MLQHGAAEVIAVDTGYGQIHARLRSDSRVKLLEKTNARYLTAEDLARAGAIGPVSFIAVDVLLSLLHSFSRGAGRHFETNSRRAT